MIAMYYIVIRKIVEMWKSCRYGRSGLRLSSPSAQLSLEVNILTSPKQEVLQVQVIPLDEDPLSDTTSRGIISGSSSRLNCMSQGEMGSGVIGS